VGPLLTGRIKDLTGSFAAGLFAAAVLALACTVTAMALRPAWRTTPGPSLAGR
jgi:cyanate permease